MRMCVCAVILAASTAAQAQMVDQVPSVQTVVVTATRVPIVADDIAAGVTVIDRAAIDQRGYTTLADALSAVAGVQIVQSGGPGANASVFVRGANSNQVQVLIDGVPVNDASGPGGAYNFGVDTLADVVRIEVVRGPMSAVYGSGAIGGVINIITERGARPATTTSGSVTIAAGLPDAVLAQADLHGQRGALDYNVAVESRSDAGFDATPRRETVYSGERDGFRTRVGSIALGYALDADTRVFADLRGRSAIYGYDDVNDPAFDDPNLTGRDNDTFGRAGVQSTLFGGAWRAGVVVAADQEYRRYVNLLDAADPNQAAEDSRYLGRRLDGQWNNVIRLPDTAWARDTTLTTGVEYSAQTAHERLDSASAFGPYLAGVRAIEHRGSGYVGIVTKVADRIVVTANAREESVGGIGSAFTWRVGGSYAIPVLQSHLKGSVGTAFLAPSLFDRYGVDSYGYIGNPALKPERSQNYEIGWSVDLPRTRMELTWFHTHVNDLITTVFAPVYTSMNIDAARLQGLEATLHVAPFAWINADLTYAYTDARDLRTGTLLLRRPYDSGSATLSLHPWPMVSVVPQILFSGGDRDALVDNAGFFTMDGHNAGTAVLNLNLSYQLDPAWRLFAWARNIAGAQPEAASGYARPGPSFLAGVHAAF